MNLVSIVINCHNGEKYLENTIQSIKSQTYSKWEIIFYDNCSTDNSEKIFKKFTNDQRFIYKKSDKFRNLYDARNEALKSINGEYVCFLDTDDYWESDKLEKQINFLQNNKEFEVVYSNFYILKQSNGEKIIRYKNKLPSGLILKELLIDYKVGFLTVCFRTQVLKNYKFNNTYNIIGDYDLILQICKNKIKIGCIQVPLATYRLHNRSLSNTRLDLHISEMEKWIKKNKNNFDNLILFKLRFFLFKLKLKKIINFFNKSKGV